jgi:hypothetical protein
MSRAAKNTAMQPLAILTGILMGTSAAIAASLSVVALLFFLLGDEHPRLDAEFWPLMNSTGIFLVLTALCAAGFLGVVRNRPWRWAAQGAMWLMILAVVVYYLPD